MIISWIWVLKSYPFVLLRMDNYNLLGGEAVARFCWSPGVGTPSRFHQILIKIKWLKKPIHISRNSGKLHKVYFMHLQCLQVGQLEILLKSVATFFCHLLSPTTIYLGHIHVKWILNLPLKSLAKQVYMQSKLGDNIALYIVTAVK